MRWSFNESPLELTLQRVLFAILLACWHPVLKSLPASQPHPIGIARFADMTFLSEPPLFAALSAVFFVCLLLYALGRFLPLALSYLLFFVVCCETLRFSHGAVGHSSQILGLVLLGQWAAQMWSLLRRASGHREAGRQYAERLALCLTRQAIAAVYVTAALSKLIRSKGLWFYNLQYFPASILKTHYEHYYDNLDARLLAKGEAVAGFFAAHPSLTFVFFGLGLFAELFAAAAIYSRLGAFVAGCLLVFMHLFILIFMALDFTTNLYVLLIYAVNVPYLALRFAEARQIEHRMGRVNTFRFGSAPGEFSANG